MSNINPNKPESDEIDLRDFFRWVGNGFSKFGESILFFIATLRNIFFANRLFFAGVIIAGIALGFFYSKQLKKEYYKSTMVISCDYLNTQILENSINKLNLLASAPDGTGYMSTLKVDKKTAVNIRGFEFKPFVSEDDVLEMEVLRTQLNNLASDKKEIVDKVIKKLEIDNKNAYEITVLVYNPNIVKPLEKALIEYFATSDYIKKRIEINKLTLEERRNKLIRESKKLDSLKSILFENFLASAKQPNRGSNNVFVSDEKGMSTLDVFHQDLDMNKQLIAIEKDLYLQSDFEIIDGFNSYSIPESDSLFKILSIAFILSILTGYLIIGAWKFDKMLARIDTTSKA